MITAPLPSGRVECRLDAWQIEEANEIARRRATHPRTGVKGYRTGAESPVTHLQGAMAEIAVAEYYEGTRDIVYGGSDDGADVEALGWRIQVKATPHSHDGIKLFNMPDESLEAHVWMLCAVRTMPAVVEIAGWCWKREIAEREFSGLRSRKTGRTIRCRWLEEHELWSPDSLFEAEREKPQKTAPPAPSYNGSRADDAFLESLPDEAMYPEWWDQNLERMLRENPKK
jgi:hypothetical protein